MTCTAPLRVNNDTGLYTQARSGIAQWKLGECSLNTALLPDQIWGSAQLTFLNGHQGASDLSLKGPMLLSALRGLGPHKPKLFGVHMTHDHSSFISNMQIFFFRLKHALSHHTGLLNFISHGIKSELYLPICKMNKAKKFDTASTLKHGRGRFKAGSTTHPRWLCSPR